MLFDTAKSGKMLVILLILVLTIAIHSCGQNKDKVTTIAKVDNKEEKAIQTLKSFYTMYMSECSKPDENLDAISSMKNKYLTKKLQGKIKDIDLDYDPIIAAQDCDESWLKTLEITSEAGQKNIYDVCYTSSFNNEKNCIKVLVIKDDRENYLIDDILSDVNLHKPIDSTLDLLIGKWFIPHDAGINITFNGDSTFVFNDFNLKTDKDEVLRGRFELNGNKLILKYNDRPQQIFNFNKGKGTDDNYYITKGKNYYFVKSSGWE